MGAVPRARQEMARRCVSPARSCGCTMGTFCRIRGYHAPGLSHLAPYHGRPPGRCACNGHDAGGMRCTEPDRCDAGPARVRRKITCRFCVSYVIMCLYQARLLSHERLPIPAPAPRLLPGRCGFSRRPRRPPAHHQPQDRGPGPRTGPHRCYNGPVITGPASHWVGSGCDTRPI